MWTVRRIQFEGFASTETGWPMADSSCCPLAAVLRSATAANSRRNFLHPSLALSHGQVTAALQNQHLLARFRRGSGLRSARARPAVYSSRMVIPAAESARFQPASDQSLLIYFGEQITLDAHERVR